MYKKYLNNITSLRNHWFWTHLSHFVLSSFILWKGHNHSFGQNYFFFPFLIFTILQTCLKVNHNLSISRCVITKIQSLQYFAMQRMHHVFVLSFKNCNENSSFRTKLNLVNARNYFFMFKTNKKRENLPVY